MPTNFHPKAEGFAAIILLKNLHTQIAIELIREKDTWSFIRSFDS